MSEQSTQQPIDLEAIEARVKAATRGPWYPFVSPWPDKMHAVTAINEAGPPIAYVGNKVVKENDANLAFIAHARDDVPALIAEVRRLTAELTALERATDRLLEIGGVLREQTAILKKRNDDAESSGKSG